METTELEQIKVREDKLHSLGFSKTRFGFRFRELFVSQFQVDHLRSFDWLMYMVYLEHQVATLKHEINKKVSDKEKMKIFSQELALITGPELRGKAAQETVDHVLTVIKELNEWINVELNKLPDDTTAGN